MIRFAWLIAILVLSAIPADSASPPTIGEEVVLDHGFRYEELPYGTEGCAIAIADSTVLLAYGELGEGIRGYRRTASGREIDINGTWLVPRESDAGPFDLAAGGGAGWKIAYLSGSWPDHWAKLLIRSLDSATLAATSPDLQIVADAGSTLGSPNIAWSGQTFLVAWHEGKQDGPIRMVRVRPDMVMEDATPLTITENAASPAFELAARDENGLVAWEGPGFLLYVRALDAEGHPTGPAVSIGPTYRYEHPLIALCPFGAGWFLAWTHSADISFARVGADGSLLAPGIGTIPTSDWSLRDLAVAAVDSSVFVTWRGGTGHVVRFTLGTEVGAIEPVYAILEPHESPYGPPAPANLACAWTGSSIALVWNEWRSPPAGEKRNLSLGHAGRALSDPNRFPVRSQWLTRDGAPLYAQPVLVTQASHPVQTVVYHAAGQFLTLTLDNADRNWMHVHSITGAGGYPGTATRFETPGDGEYPGCDECSCSWHSILGTAIRAVGPQGLLLYGYTMGSYFSCYEPTWNRYGGVYLDVLGPNGSRTDRIAVVVDHPPGENTYTFPGGYDIARGPDSYLFAYSADGAWGLEHPPHVRAALKSLDGTLLRTWTVDSDSVCTAPSVAAIGDRYLLIWLEGSTRPRLRSAVLDPFDPTDAVVGRLVVPSRAVQGTPYLIPGPDQVLCVFPMRGLKPTSKGRTDYDIYALRFTLDGEPLDAGPIPLCDSAGNQGWVGGVWDSNQYLITWCNTDPGSEALLGGRIGKNGVVCDTTGFVIQDGYKGSVSLASDEYGHVLAAYGGNRIRMIDDLVPVLDVEANWPGDPSQGDGSIPLRVGRIVPNPGLGRLHLDIDLPLGSSAGIRIFDAAGRRVRDCVANAANLANGWTWDGLEANGVPAPSGVYFFSVSTREWDVVRTGVLLR